MKTDLTKQIETRLMRKHYKMNCFNCLEVGIVDIYYENKKTKVGECDIKKYKTEICDFISYEQDKDIFRCYEIKVTKQDFYSNAKVTFVGNYNYYVMPKELYKEVERNIPKHVGVLDEHCFNLKKPKKVDLKVDKEKLLVSMIKSLNRESYKYFYKELRKVGGRRC